MSKSDVHFHVFPSYPLISLLSYNTRPRVQILSREGGCGRGSLKMAIFGDLFMDMSIKNYLKEI